MLCVFVRYSTTSSKEENLKSTAKRAPSIKEELIDDNPLVHVPFKKFESDGEDTERKICSSCSSGSNFSALHDQIVEENAQKVKREPAQTKILSQKSAPSTECVVRPRLTIIVRYNSVKNNHCQAPNVYI